MEPLVRLTSVVAPLLEDNIDTDIVFPARFLLLLDREGLGRYAFNERRGAGRDFILDRPPYKDAQILVAGRNFGTGSSREQAVWALADLGLRCVIAPSFGEIFAANCLKNGVLPLRLSEAEVAQIAEFADTAEPVTIDVEAREVQLPKGDPIHFELSDYHRTALMTGRDEIDMILAEDLPAIERFEANRAVTARWITLTDDSYARIRGTTGD